MDRGRDARAWVDRGIAFSETSLKLDPQDYNALGLLAITYAQRAQLEPEGKDPHPYFQRAFQNARKAVSINPAFRDGFTYLGSALFWQAEYDLNHGRDPLGSIREAIEAYRNSLKFAPEDWEPNANLAEFLLRDGRDFREAIAKSRAALERTLQINKEYPEAHFTLGRLEVLSGHPEKARVHLEEALRLNPKCAKAKALLGNVERESMR